MTGMKNECKELSDSNGSADWWMSGWTRLYDKIKATDGLSTNGSLMNKQSYVFLRMAGVVSKQNTEN